MDGPISSASALWNVNAIKFDFTKTSNKSSLRKQIAYLQDILKVKGHKKCLKSARKAQPSLTSFQGLYIVNVKDLVI